MLYKYVHGKGELIKTRLRRAVVPFSLSFTVRKRVYGSGYTLSFLLALFIDITSNPCDPNEAHF